MQGVILCFDIRFSGILLGGLQLVDGLHRLAVSLCLWLCWFSGWVVRFGCVLLVVGWWVVVCGLLFVDLVSVFRWVV